MPVFLRLLPALLRLKAGFCDIRGRELGQLTGKSGAISAIVVVQ